MLQCRFLTIRILLNLSLKSGKWHFRDSRFKNFPGEHALDPLENSCARRRSTRAFGTALDSCLRYGARLVPSVRRSTRAFGTALDSCLRYGARLVPLAFLLGGPSKILNRGPPDITLRHCYRTICRTSQTLSLKMIRRHICKFERPRHF
jgi:hypothetical protein